MELMSILQVHGGQHTEDVSLDNGHCHLQDCDRNQGSTTENSAKTPADCAAGDHLGSKVGDNMHDHVTGSKVGAKTYSKRNSSGEEGDLRK